jgi:Ca-activated chloride channel family protein
MSEKLTLKLAASRQGIARQGGGVHLLVRVAPPERKPDEKRHRVALALVLDRSGSMAEPAADLPATGSHGPASEVPCKLDYLREAALRMLEQMPDGDAVALVSFDDQVRVEKPLTVLSQRARAALSGAIRALTTGGSTNLEGGLRAGLRQLATGRTAYYRKLVLLSDGLANVGESRPAVLGEIAAGAAHNGTTISALGVGIDYHLGLMSHLAECGNGAFHHVDHLDELQGILAGEFLDAAAVTARNVEVTLQVPDRVAVGTNLHGYPQADIDGGVRIALGDLVRPREFLIELTTPVELPGDRLRIHVLAEGAGLHGDVLEADARLALPLVTTAEALALPVEERIVTQTIERVQARADMESALAAEAGDPTAAQGVVAGARAAALGLTSLYGPAVTERAEVGATVAYLDALARRLEVSQAPATLKSRFAMASMAGRGLGRLVGRCPACGEKAFFEALRGGTKVRSCNACGHFERD